MENIVTAHSLKTAQNLCFLSYNPGNQSLLEMQNYSVCPELPNCDLHFPKTPLVVCFTLKLEGCWDQAREILKFIFSVVLKKKINRQKVIKSKWLLW